MKKVIKNSGDIMKKDITIVIPVYNSGKYLNRCIDSIINQTINNYEILIIDDGSTDNSLNIINEYINKYNFIRVISQENSGPAVARNNGIKKTNTKYLMFIDSDDYIDNDYIKVHYDNILNTDYDVVMSGFRKTDGNNISFERKLNDKEFSKYIVTGPYSKIYKTSFLLENNIYFLDTNSSEDVYFSLKIINNSANIKTIDYIGYNYFDNINSISNTKHKGFNQDVEIIRLLNELNNMNKNNNKLNDYYIIRYCIWYLLYSGKKATSKEFMFEYNKLFNWLKDNINNYNKNKYIKYNGPEGEIKKIGKIIFIFMFLHKLHCIKVFSLIYCKG